MIDLLATLRAAEAALQTFAEIDAGEHPEAYEPALAQLREALAALPPQLTILPIAMDGREHQVISVDGIFQRGGHAIAIRLRGHDEQTAVTRALDRARAAGSPRRPEASPPEAPETA